MSDADTTLLESWEQVEEDGFIRISITGEQHCSAIVNAVGGAYNRHHPKPTLEDLEAKIGEKVTLVYGGENTFGAGMIKAREGTLFSSQPGTVAMLPKRAKRKGWRIDPNEVLDIIPGYSTAEAAERVATVRGQFPRLRKLTKERLEELPSSSSVCTLGVFGTWQSPDSVATDAIWLIGTYDKANDIADDGVLLIRPEHGTSEWGSVWGQQLLRSPVGEIVDFEPVTFKEAVELCNLDFEEAAERIFRSTLASA